MKSVHVYVRMTHKYQQPGQFAGLKVAPSQHAFIPPLELILPPHLVSYSLINHKSDENLGALRVKRTKSVYLSVAAFQTHLTQQEE